METYRDAPPARSPRGRTVRGLWRSFVRGLAVWFYGKAAQRFPARCPECGKASWDPHEERRVMAPRSSRRMNSYRCGHRGELVGTVQLS